MAVECERDLIDLLDVGSSALTAVGAGSWALYHFVVSRKTFPRAVLRHEVRAFRIGGRRLLVTIRAVVENTGEVLLQPDYHELMVQQLVPLDPKVREYLAKEGVLSDPRRVHADWPQLANEKHQLAAGDFEIETGESDARHFELEVSEETQVIQVYSYFKNPKKKGREIGWTLTTLHELMPPRIEAFDGEAAKKSSEEAEETRSDR